MPTSMMVRPFTKTLFNAPAANTQATALTAESFINAKSRIVVRSVCAVLCGDTAGPSSVVEFTLREGAGGTKRFSAFMVAPTNGVSVINCDDLNINLAANVQLQAQFEAAGGGTTSRESVNVSYYLNDQIDDPSAFGFVA